MPASFIAPKTLRFLNQFHCLNFAIEYLSKNEKVGETVLETRIDCFNPFPHGMFWTEVIQYMTLHLQSPIA